MLFPEARRSLAAAAGEPAFPADVAEVVAWRADARAEAMALPREDVARVLDVDADGVPARLYVPLAAVEDPTAGVIVHAHGGGFVFGEVEVHDGHTRRLANRSGLAVLSVDYRTPPEHPFPAAPDDLDTAVAWLEREGGRHGVGGPVVAHGDSAGGNLALVAALRHPGRFAALVLIYPFLDPTMAGESYRTHADGFGPEESGWYWQQYAGGSTAALSDPDLAPLLSDRLSTLPPTLVVTAEHDPLRDEGELLATMLAEQGVAVVSTRYQGQVHGFWSHPDEYAAAEPLMRQVAGFVACWTG